MALGFRCKRSDPIQQSLLYKIEIHTANLLSAE
jgi:hypothetical protein